MNWKKLVKILSPIKPKERVPEPRTRGSDMRSKHVRIQVAVASPLTAEPIKKATPKIRAIKHKNSGETSHRKDSSPPATSAKRDANEESEVMEWQTQFDNLPEGARRSQVIIGLDFGTAFTKVVISGEGQQYAVPLNDDGRGVDEYLLPTCLYEDGDGKFTLSKSVDCRAAHTDLKMCILDDTLDDDARERIVFYLKLVLQKSRSWFITNQRAVFSDRQLVWGINIGLPTERQADEKLQKMYRKLVGDAWAVSTKSCPTGEIGEKLNFDSIQAFPEFVAQLRVYADSPQRKSGDVHALADIGAGTTDVTVFIFHEPDGDKKYDILAASVKRFGVTALMRHRYRKFKCSESWTPQDLPPSNEEMAVKFGVSLKKIQTVDAKFANRVIGQIDSQFKQAKEKAPEEPEWRAVERKDAVSFMLCGGGSRAKFYEDVIAHLERNWRGFPIERSHLPLLSELIAPNLPDEDNDRLSVAYGLSFDSFSIGEIERVLPLPKSAPPEFRTTKCRRCNGTGGGYNDCPACGGSGSC